MSASSASQMPVRPEHSVAMLHSVARSSTEREVRPGPPNSMLRFEGQFFSSVIGEDGEDDVLAVQPW